jgi:homoserine kinase
VVGGLLLANRVLDSPVPPDELLRIAVELEGHADNVGAALQGGITIAYLTGDRWLVERLEPADDLRPAALVPDGQRVGTEEARRALPHHVDRADATFNASRAALLALALTTRPHLLPVALEDRLHQERRLDLAPASRELFLRLRDADVPLCVAGSGPTLLAFETGDRPVPDPGPGWRVLRPEVDRGGADVLEES